MPSKYDSASYVVGAVQHFDRHFQVGAAGERTARVVEVRGLAEDRENDEQRERHCHQCRYERNLRESHFYPPYGAVVLGLALSPRAGWSVIPLYLRPCAPRVLALRGMAGMLLSNDSRRPCNRMHRAVLAKPLDMSLRQHATLFLPAQRPRVNAGAGGCGVVRPIAERAAPARCLVIPAEAGIQCGRQATLVALSRPGTHPAPHSRSTLYPHLPVNRPTERLRAWIPACAGMTGGSVPSPPTDPPCAARLDSSLRWNDGWLSTLSPNRPTVRLRAWIPACAGMTGG